MNSLPILYSYTTRNIKKNDSKDKYKNNDIYLNNNCSKNLSFSKLKINVKNSVIINNNLMKFPKINNDKVVNKTKMNNKFIHSNSFEIKKPDLISKIERQKLNKLYGIDNNFNKNYIKIKKFKQKYKLIKYQNKLLNFVEKSNNISNENIKILKSDMMEIRNKNNGIKYSSKSRWLVFSKKIQNFAPNYLINKINLLGNGKKL